MPNITPLSKLFLAIAAITAVAVVAQTRAAQAPQKQPNSITIEGNVVQVIEARAGMQLQVNSGGKLYQFGVDGDQIKTVKAGDRVVIKYDGPLSNGGQIMYGGYATSVQVKSANAAPPAAPNRAPVSATLTTASVQAAVNQVVAWTQKGGSVTVTGVREIPGQNEATADLQFNNFQYNAAGFNNEPRPKGETTPTGNPAVVYIPPSAERHVANYSGQGVASMTHYTDGRWVLTRIDFDFKQLTASVPIATSSAPPAPSRPPSATLTTGSVQAAVNQVIAWTQKGGSVAVVGVREVPGQNEATADLQFNNFQYNAAGFNNDPRPKGETTPTGNPAVVYIPPSAERHVANYSGQGVASMTHYTDGRWVLTRIDFNLKQLTASVPIGTNSAPAPSAASAPVSQPAAEGRPFIKISRGGDVAFQGWQSDTITALQRAKFPTITGVVYSGSDVLTKLPASNSQSEVYVGPFPTRQSAINALNGVVAAVQPVGRVSDFSVNRGAQQNGLPYANTAGYLIWVVDPIRF